MPARDGFESRESIRSGLRILLVEDHPLNQRATLLSLARMGCVADAVDNGQEAIDAIAAGAYDVVLMDMKMPVLDGLQATQRIREQLAVSVQPYIIAMTAQVSDGDRERCIRMGVDDFLGKPFFPDDLKAALERSLRSGRLAERPRPG